MRSSMRRSIVIAAVLALSAAVSSRLAAQGLPADSVFDRLVGRWVLEGTITGKHTIHDVTIERLIGREYLQLHEVSRERTSAGVPQYEAVVLFGRDPHSGEYAMLWMDNTEAAAFPQAGVGRGSVAGDSIPFLFHYSDTDSFHTTFVYDRSRDTWQWHMDNDHLDTRRPFARLTLTRYLGP